MLHCNVVKGERESNKRVGIDQLYLSWYPLKQDWIDSLRILGFAALPQRRSGRCSIKRILQIKDNEKKENNGAHQSKVLSISSRSRWARVVHVKHPVKTALERLTKPVIDVSCTPWHQRWRAAAPHSSAIPGWSHLGEEAVPRGKLYPLTAASLSGHRGPGPGSGSYWYHRHCGCRLVGPIGREPPFSPGYHITVSSCWLLFSATWEGHRLLAARSPWAPPH